MKRIRIALAILFTVGLVFASGIVPLALAQTANEPTGFQNVRLWVNPEYDDPRLLVMLEGQIVGVEAPARVRFLVPKDAVMYSAGSKDAQGTYSGGPPARKASEIPGWDEISYELTANTFRVEYYDSIIKGGPDKTISYEFRWLFPIVDLAVNIQEPRKSTNFSVLPQGEAFADNEGFQLHFYSYDNLDDEPPLRFEIGYTRSESKPSLQVQSTSNTPVIIALVVLVVVLGGGGLYLMSRGKSKARPVRRRAAPPPAATARGKQSAPRFCTQCGKPLERPSPFCPHCGVSLQ